jgi:inhibitor of KinA sporulation pathway (predicted exonuclease)
MKPGGMAQALARAGLALDGTHHRALDDARNILRIAERAFEGRLDLLMACPPSPPPELRPRPSRPGSGHAFGP